MARFGNPQGQWLSATDPALAGGETSRPSPRRPSRSALRLICAVAISMDDGGGAALERVYERLEAIDASTIEKNGAEILFGLGFNKQMHAKKTRDFSGGWRMRIAFARALTNSTILLLDEPTNHLVGLPVCFPSSCHRSSYTVENLFVCFIFIVPGVSQNTNSKMGSAFLFTATTVFRWSALTSCQSSAQRVRSASCSAPSPTWCCSSVVARSALGDTRCA